MAKVSHLLGGEGQVIRESNFQLLLLATVFPVLGTGLVSPILDSLIVPFGTSPERIGLLISAFTAPAIVLIPVAGGLADRYGRKPVLTGSLICFGVGGAAIALTTDFDVALGLRFLQGIGFGGILPLVTTSIGDLYSGSAEATAQGLRSTATGVSAAVFPLLAGFLVTFSWTYPFVLYAAAIPTAVFVYVWYDERPGETPPTESSVTFGEYSTSLFGMVRRARIASILVARTLPTTIWIAFLTYNSLIVVRVVDGSPRQAGVLVAVTSLVFAVVSSQVGRVAATIDTPVSLLLAGHLCSGAGFLVVLFAPSILVAVVGTVTIGLGMGTTLPVYRSIITGLAPGSYRAGLVGLSEAYSRIGATVTPLVMGGLIAVWTPVVGTTTALQLSGACIAAIGVVGGFVCLLVAVRYADSFAEVELDES